VLSLAHTFPHPLSTKSGQGQFHFDLSVVELLLCKAAHPSTGLTYTFRPLASVMSVTKKNSETAGKNGPGVDTSPETITNPGPAWTIAPAPRTAIQEQPKR